MSPCVSLRAALCVVALCALAAVEVSAVRHLRGSQAAIQSASSAKSFTRRLSSACANGCSDILGTATNFGVLAGTEVTSSGPTTVTGDVGVFPGTEIVGFPPAYCSGSLHYNDSSADVAQSDAHIGYAYLQGLTYTTALSGTDLVGLTLTPGVYFFSEGAHLSYGVLTLNALGDASARFVFQMTTTWVQDAAAKVVLINNAQACNVYYQVGSSVTLGAYASITGNVVAQTLVALGHNATSTGSLISLGAAVTMDSDGVTALGECA